MAFDVYAGVCHPIVRQFVPQDLQANQANAFSVKEGYLC